MSDEHNNHNNNNNNNLTLKLHKLDYPTLLNHALIYSDMYLQIKYKPYFLSHVLYGCRPQVFALTPVLQEQGYAIYRLKGWFTIIPSLKKLDNKTLNTFKTYYLNHFRNFLLKNNIIILDKYNQLPARKALMTFTLNNQSKLQQYNLNIDVLDNFLFSHKGKKVITQYYVNDINAFINTIKNFEQFMSNELQTWRKGREIILIYANELNKQLL